MKDCLDLLFRPGDVVELRALGKMKNAVQSGYYKDFTKLAETVRILDTTGDHKGIYLVLNKINPALYARSPDKLSAPRESIATTSDADIQARRWLPVDFDPIRPTDISSSEDEHQAALQRASEVREALRAIGWPEPVLADSGNGAHLVFAIDIPNNEKATETVELVLKALDALFSDNVVKIDTKNYNASRIWKAYGTMARKGANVADRPWRRSQILEVPAELRAVPEELLASMAWEYKQKEEEERRPDTARQTGPIDLEQWLASHGLDVVKSKGAHGGGRMYILDKCPWDSSHVDRSAWAVQFPSGAIAAGCHHSGCSGKGWRDLRRIYEPDLPPKKENVSQTTPKPARKALTQIQLNDVADIEYNNDGSVHSIKFNPSRAADAICQYLNIIATPDKKIWVYEAGYYRPDGDVVIDQILDSVAGNAYSINASKEVLKKIYLRTLACFEDLDKNPYLLCVQNGIVDLLTGTFSEHSPEYHITMPCPIRYDPEERPKHFLAFLEESCSNDDDRMTLVDWMVACACLVEFEYLLFLTGHGGNGKRVYEELLQALFGSQTTEAIGLEELTSSKFAMGYLKRARMCISSETNPGRATTELIKKISGNDWLSSDVKNKDRMKFKAFTQLMFDSNSMPIFEDNSNGFRRRFTRVNMPYTFTNNPDPNEVLQKKKDGHLSEKLTSEEELSGILNLIICRAKDIAADREIHRREDDLEEYERQSMSVTDFIEQFIDFQPDYRDAEGYQLSSDFLYSKFEEYTKYVVGADIKRVRFSRLIGKYNEEPSRTIRILGMPVRGFRGLTFEDDRFNAFIEERKRLYASTNCNDLLVTKENIVTLSNAMNRNDVTNVTNVTTFRRFLMKFQGNVSQLKASEEQLDTNSLQQRQNHQAQGQSSNPEPKVVTSTTRSEPDKDPVYELCGQCDKPVPPSEASEFRGEFYCSTCIKNVLADLDNN
jgi:P4 family phage/plasmid primase-like protien